jgi:hypothetical protein
MAAVAEVRCEKHRSSNSRQSADVVSVGIADAAEEGERRINALACIAALVPDADKTSQTQQNKFPSPTSFPPRGRGGRVWRAAWHRDLCARSVRPGAKARVGEPCSSGHRPVRTTGRKYQLEVETARIGFMMIEQHLACGVFSSARKTRLTCFRSLPDLRNHLVYMFCLASFVHRAGPCAPRPRLAGLPEKFPPKRANELSIER